MTIDEHTKRFGFIAVQAGFIIEDQLVEAIRLQAELDTNGAGHKLIGEILVELGYMESSEVDEVLKLMRRAV